MATAQDEAKGLDSVTDYVEEKEMDKNAVQNAMKELAVAEAAAKKDERAKEKALAKVEIDPKDVDLINGEFEIGKAKAERVLRENGGDVRKALVALLDAPMAHEDQSAPVAQVTAVRDWLPASARSTRHGGEGEGEAYMQSAEAWAESHAKATAAFKAQHGDKADPTDGIYYTAPPPFFQNDIGTTKVRPSIPRDDAARKRIWEESAKDQWGKIDD